MFSTVIYTRFSHIINYSASLIITLRETAIAFFSLLLRFAVIVMLHELYLLNRVWNAPTSSAGTSIVVLRVTEAAGKRIRAGTRRTRLCVATPRRRRYCIQRCIGNPISYFLDRKLDSVAARGRDEDVRLIGDTRV